MLQMRLKYPHLLFKHAWNQIRPSDYQHYDISDISPNEGGGRPAPTPGTEIPNVALE